MHGVRSMLDLYNAGGPTWDELITLTREVRQKGWWRAYGAGEQDFYIGFETEATLVLDFTLAYVPGPAADRRLRPRPVTASPVRAHREAELATRSPCG